MSESIPELSRPAYELGRMRSRVSAALMVMIKLKSPVLYPIPRRLEEYGLRHPPQSWCYVEEEETTK